MHMPGKYMTAAALVDFIEAEHSTLASAVPTIWAGILQVGAEREINLSSLRMGTSGGAAMPRSPKRGQPGQGGRCGHAFNME